jgi:hypothetical protein
MTRARAGLVVLLLCLLAPVLASCSTASAPRPSDAAGALPTTAPQGQAPATTPGTTTTALATPPPATTATPTAVATRAAEATVQPAAAPAATAESAPPEPITADAATTAGESATGTGGSRELVVSGTEGLGLWLRRTPWGEQIGILRDGTPLQQIGPDSEAEELGWRRVSTPDGTEGWVAAQFTSPPDGSLLTAPAQPEVGRPVQLVIPAIGVDADIEWVGLTPDGAMAVPSGPWTVGWYRLGPLPGTVGSSVIDGHVDYRTVGPAVFWRLRELWVGDLIIVVDEDGSEHTFAVVDMASYSAKNFPLGEVFGPANTPRLNLITCDGIFNPNQREYDQRLVIYAEAID